MKRHLSEYPDVLNTYDLCEFLGISKKKAYELLTSRTIISLRIGRHYKIPKSCVQAYINPLKNK